MHRQALAPDPQRVHRVVLATPCIVPGELGSFHLGGLARFLTRPIMLPGPLTDHADFPCMVTHLHPDNEVTGRLGRRIGCADCREVGLRLVGDKVGGVA